VTLIITYVSPRRIFQCGDFRLTGGARTIDYRAQKQIIVQRFRWTALVGFCGAAHTGKEYVPVWIVDRLRETRPNAPFEELVDGLASAESWLRKKPGMHRALSFSIGAFVDHEPLFVLISNFEFLDRPPASRLLGAVQDGHETAPSRRSRW
jgi:hypothetical protein